MHCLTYVHNFTENATDFIGVVISMYIQVMVVTLDQHFPCYRRVALGYTYDTKRHRYK